MARLECYRIRDVKYDKPLRFEDEGDAEIAGFTIWYSREDAEDFVEDNNLFDCEVEICPDPKI